MRNHFAFLLSLFILSAASAALGADVVRDRIHRLEVSFDIARSAVAGRLVVPVAAGEPAAFRTGQLIIVSASRNGRPVAASVTDGVLSFPAGDAGELEIRYEGVFRGGEAVGGRNYGVVTSTIDSRGISLTGLWYPQPDGLAVWRLSAMLPAGYEAVSEAETVTRTVQEEGVLFTFDLPRPVDGLSLVATDRYEVTKDRQGDIELAAYFFKEDRALARTYLDAAKKYIVLYEKLLTPFPYRRFAVVENFLPTGYSLPTFTLLGQDVVRLPFITETSLGHEVLHQWFGNSVFIDDRRGNWAEGLTTYLADHWYEEQKGKGWEYRKQMLVNYAAYVNEKNEMPLREFRSRTDLASRAMGYGKAAMVFHMLRTRMGDERFFGALQDVVRAFPFRAASWDDLAAAFAKRLGQDLGPFFAAWLDQKGLPGVSFESAAVSRKGSRFEITLDLARTGGDQPLEVPAVISFLGGGTTTRTITLDAAATHAVLLVDEEPATLVLDPDYDLARRPVADELPPVIARLLGEERPVVALRSGQDAYRPVLDELGRSGQADQRDPAALTDAEIRTSTLVVLGADNPVVARLFGSMEAPAAGLSITVRRNPWNREKVVAIFHARSAGEAAAVSRIGHYGKYSALGFDQGRNTSKTIEPSERGIIAQLREEPVVVDLALVRRLSHVLDAASQKRIVYLGEYHDRFSHHAVQLRILRELHRRDRSLAVGMEMFQRPFQTMLDAYIAGDISEREFLERSEYFKRWGFDYNLYKPLLDFCRAEKVPVVALNLRREITEAVAKSGMDALSGEDRKDLPREMDFGDEEYRGRLRQVFEQHKSREEKNFDFFLQAQVLWDETMAESIADYLRLHPERRMAVIAGGGHMAHGAGIPKRTHRRNGLPYTIILNDGEIEPSIADFVVLPASLDGMTAPKLLATFREEGKRLLFHDFVKESPAKAAGLKAGDALIALDGVPASTLQDVKLALYLKKKGDLLLITVARKRFLLGEKVMTVEVKL